MLFMRFIIALHAEMQVIAEQVLAANGIVIEVATEDALVRAERWNADFEADHKAIFDRVFKSHHRSPITHRLS